MTARATTNASRRESSRDMGRTMRLPGAQREKPTLASAAVRLHDLYGESPATWENRIHTDYERVAKMNTALRDLGLEQEVCRLMVPVDASMAPRTPQCLADVLHASELADAAEQLADETLRHKIDRGSVTEADCDDWLQRTALQQRRAEEAIPRVLELRQTLRRLREGLTEGRPEGRH